jgi:hypothetical protein
MGLKLNYVLSPGQNAVVRMTLQTSPFVRASD